MYWPKGHAKLSRFPFIYPLTVLVQAASPPADVAAHLRAVAQLVVLSYLLLVASLSHSPALLDLSLDP